MQSGERINVRIIFKEIYAELSSNKYFRNKLNQEHHFYNSDTILIILNIDIVNELPIDYMDFLFIGVMQHILMIWLGRYNMINSSSTHYIYI